MQLTIQEYNNLTDETTKTEATLYLQRLRSVLTENLIPANIVDEKLADPTFQFDYQTTPNKNTVIQFKQLAGIELSADDVLYQNQVGSSMGVYASGLDAWTIEGLKQRGFLPQTFDKSCTITVEEYIPQDLNITPKENTCAFDYLRKNEHGSILTFKNAAGQEAVLYMQKTEQRHWHHAQDDKIVCHLYTKEQFDELTAQIQAKAEKIARKVQLRKKFINDICARAQEAAPDNHIFTEITQTEEFSQLMHNMINDMSKEHKVRSAKNIFAMLQAVAEIPGKTIENPKCLLSLFGSTSNLGVEKAATTMFGKDWKETFSFIPNTNNGSNYLVELTRQYAQEALLANPNKQLVEVAQFLQADQKDQALNLLTEMAKTRDHEIAKTRDSKMAKTRDHEMAKTKDKSVEEKKGKTTPKQNQSAGKRTESVQGKQTKPEQRHQPKQSYALEDHDTLEAKMQQAAAKYVIASFECEHAKQMSFKDVANYNRTMTQAWKEVAGRAAEIHKYQTPEYVQDLIASAVDLDPVNNAIKKEFSQPARIEKEKNALITKLSEQYHRAFERAPKQKAMPEHNI